MNLRERNLSESVADAAWQPVCLHINGQAYAVASNPAARLSDVLRDDLRLTGTKIGCHAGDCGACTVLLDGEQVCACIVALGQCEGRAVTTVEGLARADGELSPLQQAFVAHGAAQCGICTPGMLMSAESLLRTNPRPNEAEVLDAIGGVLCRCTGYRKIVEAVLSVASGDPPAGVSLDDLAPAAGRAVGARLARLDAPAKVRGHERFAADEWPVEPPTKSGLGKATGSGVASADRSVAGMLTMRVIRSPHAHARFTLGNMADFIARWPGIVDVVTAADVPHNAFAIFAELRDQPVLADGLVRFAGEAVVALVGEAEAVFAVPESEVPIAYEVLPAFVDMPGALQAAAQGVLLQATFPDNVLCRGRVARGNVDAVFDEASVSTKPPHIAECRFETVHVEHAYIEPEAGYAQWLEPKGAAPRIRIYACTQTPFMDRDEIAHVMGLTPAQVHIVPSAIGGGFGGKLDLSVQPLLAVAARKTRRAVRLVYERPESMQSSTKRHPSDMHARAACDASGRLSAYDFDGDFNTGAYSSWGPTVANRVPIHASGPYRIPNVRATTRAVLTHNSVAGAFRGFGVPQSTLINESLLDELAAQCGMDQLDFRHLNALRAGDTTPTGQVLAASVGLQECLDALRPAWLRAKAEAAAFNASASHLRRGAGIACMWYGIGNTVIANPSTMRGSLRLSAKRGAHLFLYNGAQEIGQGTATVMPQMFADAVGLPVACVEQVMGDTDLTLDAGKSSASRQTFVSGNAARFAGEDLRRQLLSALGVDEDEAPAGICAAASPTTRNGGATSVELRLEGPYLIAGDRRIDLRDLPRDANGDVLTGVGHFNPPTVPLDADGQGVPYATFGFAAQIAELEVDTDLGTVKLLHIHAAHDVGRAINPTQVEGQVHGGIAQGIGLALMEEYVNGRTDNLHDYLIPTAGDVPPITVHLIEDPEPLGPWGAKGVGEPALVATAPAILNAIFDAVGVRMNRVPVTPTRLRAAMLTRGAR
ncbi:molybdopterin-dependent oxidoreductase [soil metagenome]